MDVTFLLDLAILLFSAKVFGIWARRLGAPEVVGEIIAGLLVGPAALGFVAQTDFLSQMAEAGVIMLMFEAGLGTNLKELRQTGWQATMIACAGVTVAHPVKAGVYKGLTRLHKKSGFMIRD